MERLRIQLSEAMTIEIENDDAKEIVKAASFWMQMPSECPICKAPLVLMYRHPQDYHYYGLECKGETKHELNFGQHKQGDTLYFDPNKSWRVFNAQTTREETMAAQQAARAAEAVRTPQQAPANGYKEPQAELDRLEREIQNVYDTLKPSWDLHAAIEKQAGKPLAQLDIQARRSILERLTALLPKEEPALV